MHQKQDVGGQNNQLKGEKNHLKCKEINGLMDQEIISKALILK